MKIKIFYNEKFITTSNVDYKSSKNQLKITELTSENLTSAKKVISLFDSYDVIHITDTTPDELLKRLKTMFKHIYADGGVVKNEFDQTLMIYRNDKWDLPKGKREKGEDSITCAQREVEEECGIKVKTINKQLLQSYHLYQMKGKWIIKTTTWFDMKSSSQSILTPQTEEGISDIRWVDSKDIDKLLQNSYANIIDIFENIGCNCLHNDALTLK